MPYLEKYIRFSYCVSQEDINEGIDRLEKALSKVFFKNIFLFIQFCLKQYFHLDQQKEDNQILYKKRV